MKPQYIGSVLRTQQNFNQNDIDLEIPFKEEKEWLLKVTNQSNMVHKDVILSPQTNS